MIDPEALPVPDLGLRCLACDYDLRGAPEHRCPECGKAFSLDDYVPAGAYPPLSVSGQLVTSDSNILDLLERYQIPVAGALHEMDQALGFQTSVTRRPVLTVPRDYYWDAVDLILRHRRNQPLPEEPQAAADGPDWQCPNCGEENPGNFDICWHCGTEHGSDSRKAD